MQSVTLLFLGEALDVVQEERAVVQAFLVGNPFAVAGHDDDVGRAGRGGGLDGLAHFAVDLGMVVLVVDAFLDAAATGNHGGDQPVFLEHREGLRPHQVNPITAQPRASRHWPSRSSLSPPKTPRQTACFKRPFRRSAANVKTGVAAKAPIPAKVVRKCRRFMGENLDSVMTKKYILIHWQFNDNSIAERLQTPENSPVASSSKPVISVQVRELIELACRTGDLGGDRQFVGRERGLAGTRGHRKIQRSRPAGYQKEVAVSYELDAGEFRLRVQGRLDGLWVSPSEVVIEEIKTVQGPWDHTADPLHWAQVKIYGYICAQDHAWNQVILQLTYLDLETGEVTEFREPWAEPALTHFFQATTAIYLDWITQQQRWRRIRDESIRALNFPFSDYRPGQRPLAVTAYRTLVRGGCLFVEAPTGIGKTVAIIFPTLKAIAEGKLDRIFYLTARTVGRMVAENTFAQLRQSGLRLQSLTLTAKEKICPNQDQPCDQAHCALAIGYYDRVKPAMRATLSRENLTREVIEASAHAYQVCPFELSLELSEWVDAVVCDYNYVFDTQVYLRRHFDEPKGNYALLVDEAHNLVDRAREMYSAELESREIHKVQRAIKETVPRCARALGRLAAALRNMGESSGSPSMPAESGKVAVELDLFFPESVPPEMSTKPPGKGDVLPFKMGRDGVLTTPYCPEHLIPLIEKALQEAEAWLVKNQPAEFRSSLLELFFRLQAFLRVAEQFDASYVTLHEPPSGRAALLRRPNIKAAQQRRPTRFITSTGANSGVQSSQELGAWSRLRLFCLDPSRWLGRPGNAGRRPYSSRQR